ncbi:MAG: Holliday junction branch migration protein RuvA [Candidatus Vogelbacteria bacterium]|nr:Holliday junction branch migration protein RuvA [Candidatus Vogelbacteria bacterium]
MIGQLKGTTTYLGERFIILDIAGVGYKVYVTIEALRNTKIGNNLVLWTHLVVREDALDLYGFIDKNELDFFQLLISISGVGPKGALSILSLAPPETLRKAISSSNTGYLTQVSGIGRKIAEKIVLELKDKIGHLEIGNDNLDQEAEAVMALEALGYSNREARESLRKIPDTITETGAKIKEALKQLHR